MQRFLKMFVQGQDQTGLLVLSAHDHSSGERQYKRWPAAGWVQAARWAEEQDERGRSVYYKTCLFKPDAIRLIKENALPEAVWLWADLDEMDPARLPFQPTMLIESSPRRYQALWRLSEPKNIKDVERYCHAISAYGDASGWDIGQELRIPGTHNWKYDDGPEVRVSEFTGTVYQLAQLGITPARETGTWVEPDTDFEELLAKRTDSGPSYTQEEPVLKAGDGKGRSAALWRVLNQLRDDGYKAEQAFQIMWWSPLNKFRLDGRPPRDLWRDVLKCWNQPMAESTPFATPEPRSSPKIEQVWRWPLLVDKAISAYRGPTLFVDEATAVMFLSAYSALFPYARIEGHNIGVWTMLLGGQASGKSTLIEGLSRVMVETAPSLGLVTSGSPEGIMERVAEGPCLLAFEEYSEQLKQMAKRDGYAVTNKELYQRMFDGAPLGHATRRKAIQASSTYVVMMASTNADTWRRYGDPDDMANGYLSRFMVIAQDLVERSVNRTGLAEALAELTYLVRERAQYGAQVRHVHLSNMRGVNNAEDFGVVSTYEGMEMSDGDLILLEYQNELERTWDLKHNLDESSLGLALAIPPGRTLTKARKLAATLELCEANPQIAGDALYVRPSNVRTAIALSRLSVAWAQRAIDWLQQSEDKEFVDRILHQLRRVYPEYVRPWDVAVNIRGINATGVKKVMQMMLESGMVERKMQPRSNGAPSELWRALEA